MTKTNNAPEYKPGELKSVPEGPEGAFFIDYIGAEKKSKLRDGLLVWQFLNRKKLPNGNSLLEELESRGYDLTTLQFSIKQKVPQ